MAYRIDIKSLTTMFAELKKPSVEEPEEPNTTTTKDKEDTVEIVSKFEEIMYKDRIKQWIQDIKSLKATVQSI